IASWNDIMNELGLDTISAGGTIAWAMEAGEQGLRNTELRFGRTDNIASILDDIAYRRGEGADLAEGSRSLSRRYGGGDFAIQVKGLECAAYDPRSAWGHGLGYAVYNKGGCHLGSFLVGLERILGYMMPHITMGKARWVAFMENLYAGVNSLQVCQFTIYGLLTEPPIPRLLPRFVLKIATAAFPRLAISLLSFGHRHSHE
ncbi:MAG: aldehyde ferredoxin oxidoreductase C-terminal domain-containing protein, partial [Spirochaetaceae bacterium]|nr:aldehyde ferredoxin oxidoreductase C-terminal domain-containing protein [Spirochaetaceae bacterium]